jgi:hypothetical protein
VTLRGGRRASPGTASPAPRLGPAHAGLGPDSEDSRSRRSALRRRWDLAVNRLGRDSSCKQRHASRFPPTAPGYPADVTHIRAFTSGVTSTVTSTWPGQPFKLHAPGRAGPAPADSEPNPARRAAQAHLEPPPGGLQTQSAVRPGAPSVRPDPRSVGPAVSRPRPDHWPPQEARPSQELVYP